MRFTIALSAFIALSASTALASGFPVTVKSCDREVTFEEAPKRAISQDVNLTDMMLALDLTGSMAGISGISGWYKMDAEMKAKLGDLPEIAPQYPTKEVLLEADADLFFAGWNYGMKVGGEVTPETLEPFGIKVYELTESCIHIMKKDKSSMEDMYTDILNLGRIFGVSEKAEALVAGYRKQIAEATASVPEGTQPLKVFVYDSGEEKPFTAGRFGMPTALIEAAGGVNIMEDVETSWTEVGWEPVIERNPEVVVIVDYGEVTAEQKIAYMRDNPAFKDIPAVKNNRFVVLPYVEATPGPRNINAVKTLADAFQRSTQ
ncbi:ABC transporter substrate-binding protein [Ciceribacter sp. L1K23]|uniref:ABC transporter substrate-binding protein n=1 Tax=Ciceribacter sp. L1K23 TaxID=2820276 RepID=UPI001B81615A|nr:ABC transporter substrate-binding protein [Ciceribacter sp. L1K23]MBR0556545.1 ABC transporter substrate-binding protein [Ciceribacter sp. L1K23]